MITLTIKPEWQAILEQEKLADFESLMAFSDGKTLSIHPRGKTNIYHLKDGRIVFVKQDYYTKFLVCLRQICHFKKPQPNTEKERSSYMMAAEIGIRVPEVIAWGQERTFGLPNRAVMITLPVSGKPLDMFYAECKDTERKAQALANAEKTLAMLQDAGLDWKTDCKPEHFFVADDLSISLIDLERLHKRRKPLSEKLRALQFKRLHSLLPKDNA